MSEPPRPPSESFGSAPDDSQPPAPPPPPPAQAPFVAPQPPPMPPPAPPTSSFGSAPPPPPGYPAGPPAAGPSLNDDRTWLQIAHFGGALGALIGVGAGGWIAPLVALVGRGNLSPNVRAHAVAALNFQILVTLVTVAGYLTLCILIGFIIIPIAMIAGILFGVLGGVKANEGAFYKYPITINLVK